MGYSFSLVWRDYHDPPIPDPTSRTGNSSTRMKHTVNPKAASYPMAVRIRVIVRSCFRETGV